MSEQKVQVIHQEQDEHVKLYGLEDYHQTIASVRGEQFLEYRRQWESAGRFELETRVPLHIDIELSTYCNFRCVMCPFGIPKAQRPPAFDAVRGWFDLELFKKIVDEGVEKGLSAIDLSYYTEPLLHKQLFEFIHYAGEKGVMDIMMSSNGQLLTPELTEKILDSPLTRMMFSLDALNEETYNQVRIGGDFQTVIGNVKHFLKRKRERGQTLPIVRVSFVNNGINTDEHEAFLEEWKDQVDYISMQTLISFEGMSQDVIPVEKVAGSADVKCHQPWHRMSIRADGQALPCCTTYGQQMPVGNLNDMSLEEAWNSPLMQELRVLHREGRYYENALCKACIENTSMDREDIIPISSL